MSRPLMFALLVLCVAHSSARAQEWTRFRGPNGSGISAATTVPVTWSADDYRWVATLPGRGHGSPVVWDRHVYVPCEDADGAVRVLVCLDSDSGDTLWTRTFDVASHKKHKHNSFASSTPAADELHVYVAWGTRERVTVAAIGHDGSEAWQADLGPHNGGHGFASSPIVYQDIVVIPHDQEGGGSLVALDRVSGAKRWEVPRRAKRETYSTPCVYQHPLRGDELIFTNWQHGITGIDPVSGRLNWETAVFDTTTNERCIGSPIVDGERVIGTCAFFNNPKQLVVVRPGDGGPDDVTELYRVERGVPHIPTPLAFDGRLYLLDDMGVLSCHVSESGKKLWQARVGGNFFGSPVCVNGVIYAVSDIGEVVVITTGDEYRELARVPLGDAAQATPAVANGTLFLRTETKLFALGGPR